MVPSVDSLNSALLNSIFCLSPLNKKLLWQMDGFEQDKRVIVIAATNRKQDLDPALLR